MQSFGRDKNWLLTRGHRVPRAPRAGREPTAELSWGPILLPSNSPSFLGASNFFVASNGTTCLLLLSTSKRPHLNQSEVLWDSETTTTLLSSQPEDRRSKTSFQEVQNGTGNCKGMFDTLLKPPTCIVLDSLRLHRHCIGFPERLGKSNRKIWQTAIPFQCHNKDAHLDSTFFLRIRVIRFVSWVTKLTRTGTGESLQNQMELDRSHMHYHQRESSTKLKN